MPQLSKSRWMMQKPELHYVNDFLIILISREIGYTNSHCYSIYWKQSIKLFVNSISLPFRIMVKNKKVHLSTLK